MLTEYGYNYFHVILLCSLKILHPTHSGDGKAAMYIAQGPISASLPCLDTKVLLSILSAIPQVHCQVLFTSA